MCLNRFVVTSSFRAWSPGDRNFPERSISISPGPRDLFTDEDTDKESDFVKFLKNGLWYEAEWEEFAHSTALSPEREFLTAKRG